MREERGEERDGEGHNHLHVRNALVAQQRRAALHVVEGGQRHAPAALPREAPLPAPPDEGLEPRARRRRLHPHAIERGQRAPLQRAEPHKPLRRRAEDGWRLGAPVVRVAVRVHLRRQQRPALAQRRQNGAVALAQHLHPRKRRRLVGGRREAPRRVDGARERQRMRLADAKVVGAVRRRRVHEAGARAVGHVATEEQRHRPPRERVRAAVAAQLGPAQRAPRGQPHAERRLERLEPRRRHQQLLPLAETRRRATTTTAAATATASDAATATATSAAATAATAASAVAFAAGLVAPRLRRRLAPQQLRDRRRDRLLGRLLPLEARHLAALRGARRLERLEGAAARRRRGCVVCRRRRGHRRDRVLDLLVGADRLVGGDGPRRRGPYWHEHAVVGLRASRSRGDAARR